MSLCRNRSNPKRSTSKDDIQNKKPSTFIASSTRYIKTIQLKINDRHIWYQRIPAGQLVLRRCISILRFFMVMVMFSKLKIFFWFQRHKRRVGC